jgi:hypothetical protein
MAEMLAPSQEFGSPALNRGLRKRGNPWIGWAITSVLLLAIIGTLGGLYYTGIFRPQTWFAAKEDFSNANVYDSPFYNYRFAMPASAWKGDLDHQIKTTFKAPVTLRRMNPNSWLTMALAKTEKRTPQEAELLDEGVRRLREYFRNMEWEQMQESRGKPPTLGGQPAVRIVFTAEANDIPMTG